MKLLMAIQKEEVDKYLIGENGYAFANKWVEEPTDLGAVFSGLNSFAERNDELFLNNIIKKALIKLLNSPIGCWWVVNILYEYLFGFNENTLLFKIDLRWLAPLINKFLAIHYNSLYNNKELVGWRFENGLWGSLLNIAPKINQELEREGIQIIDLS